MSDLSRRSFLKGALGTAGLVALGGPLIATFDDLFRVPAFSVDGSQFGFLLKTTPGEIMPVGSIQHVVSGFEQEGWIPCDGRLLSRTQYPALYAAIGNTYG